MPLGCHVCFVVSCAQGSQCWDAIGLVSAFHNASSGQSRACRYLWMAQSSETRPVASPFLCDCVWLWLHVHMFPSSTALTRK